MSAQLKQNDGEEHKNYRMGIKKIDLVTGFLGSGKTTFLKKYVRFLLDRGLKVGILENDYGAVNVDMMLLSMLAGENCQLETVAGACDKDCHIRRFKTKLIAMGMSDLDRVIIEPSGIFDIDEFLDVMHEPPLDRWYEIGSVIAIVDAQAELPDSEESEFFMASELADAGMLVFSKTRGMSPEQLREKLSGINNIMKKVQCDRSFDSALMKDWDELGDSDLEAVMNSGYYPADFVKSFSEYEGYRSVYFMNRGFTTEELRRKSAALFADKACGNVMRVKGFATDGDGWFEFNATKNNVRIEPLDAAQDVVIVIGEDLNEERINRVINN